MSAPVPKPIPYVMPPLPAECCGRCRHFSFEAGDGMAQHNFGRCAFLSVGHYHGRYCACIFRPARFQQKEGL